MDIYFGKMSNAYNYVGRAFDYTASTGVLHMTGTLREGTSMIAPSILLDMTDRTWDNYNYCYIPAFSRYYFIADLALVRNNLWQVSLHVDVLKTYATQIRNTYALIGRSQSNGRLGVIDDNIRFRNRATVEEHEVTNISGSSVTKMGNAYLYNIALTWYSDRPLHDASSSGSYDGEFGTAYSQMIESPETGTIPNVYTSESSYHGSRMYTAVMSSFDFLTFAQSIYQYESAMNFVIGAYVFPFNLSHGENNVVFQIHQGGLLQSDVTFTGYYPTDLSGEVNLLSPAFCVADFQAETDNNLFYSYEPYSKYELYLPYYGWVQVPSHDYLGSRIRVYYTPCYQDGKALIQVCNVTQGRIIWSGSCQLGRSIPVVATDQVARNLQIGLGIASLSLNLIASALVAGGSMALGTAKYTTPMGELTGGLEQATTQVNMGQLAMRATNVMQVGYMASNVIQAGVSLANTLFTPYSVTGKMPDNDLALYEPQSVRVRITYKSPVISSTAEGYVQQIGRPCGEYHRLSELTGYTTCDAFRLEGFTGATDTEIAQVDRLLHNGIIL